MEEFLAKSLVQSGLGAVGVLALLYVVRELGRIQKDVARLANSVVRIERKVAVIRTQLRYVPGIKFAPEDDDDEYDREP